MQFFLIIGLKNAISTPKNFEVAEPYFKVAGRVSAPATLSLHVKSLKKSMTVIGVITGTEVTDN